MVQFENTHLWDLQGAGDGLEGTGNNLQGDDYDDNAHVLQLLGQGADRMNIQDIK